MKSQITSVLLCILLSSSLGHDYRARKSALQPKASKHLSHFSGRDAGSPSDQCQWVCDGGADEDVGLRSLGVSATGLVAAVNITAGVALVVDVNLNLTALFNGESGEVIAINLANNTGVYISANVSNAGWLKSNQSFDAYLKSLTSLKVFLDLNVGTSIDVSSTPAAILDLVGNILSHLSIEFQLQINKLLKQSLNIVLKIASSLLKVLHGPLKGIEQQFDNQLIQLQGDIHLFVNVLEGLGQLVASSGGLSGLIKAGVKLNLALLFNSANGVEFLVNYLLALVARVDLSVLANLLNSLESLASMIAKLGDETRGINGIFKIISEIVGLIDGKLDIKVLVNTLLQVVARLDGDIDISAAVEGLLSVIQIQGNLHGSAQLSGFISIVGDIQNRTLTVGKVNISEIINDLETVVSNLLDLVIKVLSQLVSAVKMDVSVSELILCLLSELTSSLGIQLLEKIIPDISIPTTPSGDIDISAILKQIKIPSIIKLISSGNIYGALKSIPVVKDIVSAVNKVLNEVTNGSLSLEKLLTSSSAKPIVTEIATGLLNLCKISGNISGSISGGISVGK